MPTQWRKSLSTRDSKSFPISSDVVKLYHRNVSRHQIKNVQAATQCRNVTTMHSGLLSPHGPRTSFSKLWLCACACVCVCVCIYIYIYTHTHTHTHTYIYTHINDIYIYIYIVILPSDQPKNYTYLSIHPSVISLPIQTPVTARMRKNRNHRHPKGPAEYESKTYIRWK